MAATPSSRAGLLSLLIGAAILSAKFFAYFHTGSHAILSDALEGIVNIVAAAVAFITLIISNRPADKNHPYGHGKAEYFSASFEGGLIAFAAVAIIGAGIHGLIVPHEITDISSGLWIIGAAGAVNLFLGLYLLKQGRAAQSSALVASAHHLFSDFWTTVAVIVGLGLVAFTGITILDSFVALGIGALLARTGIRIVREAFGGLLDEEDDEIIEALVQACNKVHIPGIIEVHFVRVIRSGSYHFVDAHVVVPEFWEVRHAHDEVNLFAKRLIEAHSHPGEAHFHIDPCRQMHCSHCDFPQCPIRKEPFQALIPYSVDGITSPKAT